MISTLCLWESVSRVHRVDPLQVLQLPAESQCVKGWCTQCRQILMLRLRTSTTLLSPGRQQNTPAASQAAPLLATCL